MVREQGVIERVSDRKALVRIEKNSACATCESRDNCDVTSGKAMIIEVANELRAGEGDRVEISVPSRSFLKLAMLVYFLPVATLIAGAYAGGEWAESFHVNTTLGSIVVGCAATGVTFYFLKRFDRSSRKSGKLSPKMTRILLRARQEPSGPADASN